jgi:lipoate---protein ligase
MALDQALMSKVDNFIPVLRVYGWKPAAVSIGYFQSLEQEVDVKKCRDLGIDVVRRTPLNDITVNNKKVSGNAQTRRNGVLLQHGTILLDIDIDKMFSVL